MRIGVFVGFLIGAAIASFLGKKQQEEALPPVERAQQQVREQVDEATGKGPIDELKARLDEAAKAAKEAAEEKEAELMRRYNESTGQG